ncbi:MAG: ABC transporter substrate-binding protein [bacterium]
MTKLLNIAIVLLTAGLVAVILVPQLQEGRPRVVRFACDSTIASLPFFVAEDRGLFADNRIIPEIEFYSDPDLALAELLAGKADVGVFPWITAIQHVSEHEETLRVFMSQDFRATIPVDAIVVTKASRIGTIKDLQRQKLGYPPQLRGAIQPFLLQADLPAELVTTIELPLSQLTASLASGDIGAAWLIEPLVAMLDTSQFRVLEIGALPKFVSAPYPGAAVGFSPEFMNTGKVMLSRLKLSLDAAASFADGKTDSARVILARYLGYDPELLAACRMAEVQRLVEINKPAIRTLASRLAVSGIITGDVDTDKMFVPPARMTR